MAKIPLRNAHHSKCKAVLILMETYRCTTLVFDRSSSCIDDDYQRFHCWLIAVAVSETAVWLFELFWNVTSLFWGRHCDSPERWDAVVHLNDFDAHQISSFPNFKCIITAPSPKKPLHMCVAEGVDFHMVTLPQIPHIVQGSQTLWWRPRL